MADTEMRGLTTRSVHASAFAWLPTSECSKQQWRPEIDVVVVWKLDRFGRSLVHCISGIQELASIGIRFITASGVSTPTSPTRRTGS